MNPRTAAFGEATRQFEVAVAGFVREQPGVVTAIRAAGHVVLRHDFFQPKEFSVVYGFVEPEIPFAELERPRGTDSEDSE